MPSDWDRIAEHWDREAADRGVFHQRSAIDPVMLKVIGQVRGKRVLEIGCGNGYFSRLLARKGARVIALDISRKMIEFALLREEARPAGVRYLRADASRSAGFSRRLFDLVVANMCLMDMANLGGVVREASRVLRKDGRFVFSLTHPVFCDFNQRWTVVREKGGRIFGRTVLSYLSSTAKREKLRWYEGRSAVKYHYHRSIDTHFRCLAAAGFLVDAFREVRTKKNVTRATRADGDVTQRRSLFRHPSEKRMKERAGREIPLFLVVGAVKRA